MLLAPPGGQFAPPLGCLVKSARRIRLLHASRGVDPPRDRSESPTLFVGRLPLLMPCRDVTAEARHWAMDEVRVAVNAGDPAHGGAVLLSASETYGVAVTWVILGSQGPAGQPVQVPIWFLAVTCDNPILGEPGLSYCQQVGSPVPTEVTVRGEVRKGIAALRALHASKLAAGNGHHSPPGLT